jgi:hypothetical protein
VAEVVDIILINQIDRAVWTSLEDLRSACEPPVVTAHAWPRRVVPRGAPSTRRMQGPAGRCKSTCMNSMQTGIMPCATFITVPFQQSSSHSLEHYPRRTFRACQVLQCKVAARQWRCLAEIVSFSGSCSRCPELSPLPCPTLPKQPKLVCGYCVKGMSVVQALRCCAMSAALVPRSCNQGRGRCAHQLSERANASSPCLNINHKPLEASKNVVVEACKRWQHCPVGL